MIEPLHAENRLLRDRFVRFAAEHIAGREDLNSGEGFPHDLWRWMGEQGLFQVGIPETYGGCGGSWHALIVAGEALVAEGHNLGLALSWLVQQAQAHFLIDGFGDEEQRRRLLPEMAGGRLTTAFAVSEPEHGAHPKHLATKAERDGARFRLSGEKAYLTNGPIADLYIVIAVTSEEMKRKRFTAFLVPRETTGLSRVATTPLPFLLPSPHGGITLADCPVPVTAILGEEGAAYEAMVIPFGGYEELLMTGPILGALQRLEALTIAALRSHASAADRSLQGELGEVHALIGMLQAMAYKAAEDLEAGAPPASLSAMIPWMHLAAALPERLTAILARSGLGPAPAHARLQSDLAAFCSLGRRRLLIRQERLGAALLEGGD